MPLHSIKLMTFNASWLGQSILKMTCFVFSRRTPLPCLPIRLWERAPLAEYSYLKVTLSTFPHIKMKRCFLLERRFFTTSATAHQRDWEKLTVWYGQERLQLKREGFSWTMEVNHLQNESAQKIILLCYVVSKMSLMTGVHTEVSVQEETVFTWTAWQDLMHAELWNLAL